MKNISLELGITIPIEKYAPMRVGTSITEEKLDNETDEELFQRAMTKLQNSFEAHTAIQAFRFLNIKEESGLLAYANGLAEELAISDNSFIVSYLDLIKESQQKAKQLTIKGETNNA